jgi:hypothetical protein
MPPTRDRLERTADKGRSSRACFASAVTGGSRTQSGAPDVCQRGDTSISHAFQALRAADAAGKRAVAERDHDRLRRCGHLREQFGADRLVGLVLQRLGPLLKVGDALGASGGVRGVLRLVEVATRNVDVDAVLGEQLQLGCARASWRKHGRRDPKLAAGPADSGAVVSCRGGDNGAMAVAGEATDDRQSAAPLKGADLMEIFALQPQIAAAGEVIRSTLEGVGTCILSRSMPEEDAVSLSLTLERDSRWGCRQSASMIRAG